MNEVATVADTEGITRDDVRAMRLADAVHFHTHEGRSFIVAELRDYGSDRIFTATEQRLFPQIQRYAGERSREILVAFARLEDYSGRDGEWSGFATYCPDEVWATIAGALRPDDVLGFHWVASNNSENLDRIGYHHDQLRMGAMRPDRKNKRHWIIRDEVGPDNSARMVQRKM